VRTRAQVDSLALFDPERDTRFVNDAIRLLSRELGPHVPVIGFAAAPWTLACYMIQGKSREGFPAAKTMLLSEPAIMRSLLEKIARATAHYLKSQIAAGAAAVQLFDTWAGELDERCYRAFGLQPTQILIEELRATGAPVILYSKNSNHLLDLFAASGADVLSLDWRADFGAIRERLGDRIALQGNVDPCVLFAPEDAIVRAARDCVQQTGGRGHILNLGHGILPETPVSHAQAFVRAGQSAPLQPSREHAQLETSRVSQLS
jgi:uroporphyrinogen decarboxylase